MRILLIGNTGQVGWELQRTLITLGEVISASRQATHPSLQIDLSTPDTIRNTIRLIQPDLIINAAAYTAVDKAETEPELAMAINGTAPGIIAAEAKLIGAALIHYSTDYIFNGHQTIPYTEQDQPDPQNIYGKTKLAGEQAIQTADIPHLTLRTSWVYGLRGQNFLLTMLKLAQQREELRIVNDQIGSPTWSRLIAQSTAQIITQAKHNCIDFLNQHSGIYHLTATGQTTWYEFAKTIFAATANYEQRKLQNLLPITTTEYPTPAQRPAYSCLNTQKISQTFGLHLPNWERNFQLVIAAGTQK